MLTDAYCSNDKACGEEGSLYIKYTISDGYLYSNALVIVLTRPLKGLY